jgi:hypothetical protein
MPAPKKLPTTNQNKEREMPREVFSSDIAIILL